VAWCTKRSGLAIVTVGELEHIVGNATAPAVLCSSASPCRAAKAVEPAPTGPLAVDCHVESLSPSVTALAESR